MSFKYKDTALRFTYCHRKPERSFFWKGKQFPVCARCTGIHIGYISLPLFVFGVISIPIWWTIALMVPTYLDGLTQVFFDRESNNVLRLTTGIMAGVGTMSFTAIIGQYIGNQILLLMS